MVFEPAAAPLTTCREPGLASGLIQNGSDERCAVPTTHAAPSASPPTSCARAPFSAPRRVIATCTWATFSLAGKEDASAFTDDDEEVLVAPPVLSKVRITGQIPPRSTKRRQVGNPVSALDKRIKT